jgi:hypothetical protein
MKTYKSKKREIQYIHIGPHKADDDFNFDHLKRIKAKKVIYWYRALAGLDGTGIAIAQTERDIFYFVYLNHGSIYDPFNREIWEKIGDKEDLLKWLKDDGIVERNEIDCDAEAINAFKEYFRDPREKNDRDCS